VKCDERKGGKSPYEHVLHSPKNSCDNIPKCIVDYYTLIPTEALKQMGT
jgi:hypothetical protein